MARLAIFIFHVTYICCFSAIGSAFSMESTTAEFQQETADERPYEESDYLPYTREPSIPEIQGDIMQTALVYEPAEKEGQLRLVNGGSMYEGRLEIYHAGRWGTVCDDRFRRAAATVVCRELGMSADNTSVHASAYFGQGIGPIHLDEIDCIGTESRLIDCRSNSWERHNCFHSEDVGVSCNTAMATSTDFTDQAVDVSAYHQSEYLPYSPEPSISEEPIVMSTLVYEQTEYQPYSPHPSIPEEPLLMSSLVYEQTVTHGQLRLVNGRSMYDGRLEIYLEDTWGTICDDDFGIYDARVACRQLGLPSWNVRVYGNAYFGQGNGPIQMDDVNCHGSESRLLYCGHRGRRYHNCGHYEDVGIACLLVSTSPEGSYQTIDVSAYHQTEYLLNSLEPSISDEPMDTSTLMYDPTDSIDTSTTSQFRPATWPATWSQAPIAGFTIHTAGTLIDPYRHGSNHCLRLAYQPRTRNASPGDLKVKFIPRDGWLSHRMLWQNTGEQVMKWFSHNLALYITTAGWIVVDDYNARNIEIAEQTITQGTCDYIET